METESLFEQVAIAAFLMCLLIGLYFLPTNAEIAARFRAWKAARAPRKVRREEETRRIVL